MLHRLGFLLLLALLSVGGGGIAGRAHTQDYEPELEIYEGSVGCVVRLRGPGGEMLWYDAWIHDPAGNVVASDSKFTYSSILWDNFAVEPQTSGNYKCRAKYYSEFVGYIGELEQTRFINQCGDERGTIISEYNSFNVNFKPTCNDFSSSGGSAHFSWSELNGMFAEGNQHNPWGIVRGALIQGLEGTRSNMNNEPITLESGYRCPHGNAPLPGSSPQSNHMEGIAADMYVAGWNYTRWNEMRAAALMAGATEIEPYEWDPSHLHAAWE